MVILRIKLLSLAVITGCWVLVNCQSAIAQRPEPIVVGGNQGVDGRDCDDTKAQFAVIAHAAGDEKTIIVISRLGRGESSRQVARRRLQNLEDFLYLTHGVSRDRIVSAEGKRVVGLGEIDVYLDGKLFVLFRMRRNKDFLTNCQP